MSFTQDLRTNFGNYFLFLDDGGEPEFFLEERFHVDGLVHCSQLRDCPLKAAKEYSHVEPVFPQFTKRANTTIMYRMQQGVRMAQMFQESLLWGAKQKFFDYSAVEQSIASRELMIQGRYDAFVRDSEDKAHIIEIKHRGKNWKNSMGQPRIGDVFQMLAYQTMLGDCESHLIILANPEYKDFFDANAMMEIWSLIPDGEGYKLVSEHGYDWANPENNGSIINVRCLREEIDRQLRYLNGETIPPIDLMNRDESWQCASVKRYPKEGRPGILTPVCSHFCHCSPEVALQGLEYDENGVIYDF